MLSRRSVAMEPARGLTWLFPWIPILLPITAVLLFLKFRPSGQPIPWKVLGIVFAIILLVPLLVRYQTREARRAYALPVTLVVSVIGIGRYYFNRLRPR